MDRRIKAKYYLNPLQNKNKLRCNQVSPYNLNHWICRAVARNTIPIRQKPTVDDLLGDLTSSCIHPVAMNIQEFFFSHYYHNNTSEHTAVYKQGLTPWRWVLLCKNMHVTQSWHSDVMFAKLHCTPTFLHGKSSSIDWLIACPTKQFGSTFAILV